MNVSFYIPQRDDDVLWVDAMRVHGQLSVDIPHQDDAAGQAERQSQEIEKKVNRAGEKFSPDQIIGTLQDMNFLKVTG